MFKILHLNHFRVWLAIIMFLIVGKSLTAQWTIARADSFVNSYFPSKSELIPDSAISLLEDIKAFYTKEQQQCHSVKVIIKQASNYSYRGEYALAVEFIVKAEKEFYKYSCSSQLRAFIDLHRSILYNNVQDFKKADSVALNAIRNYKPNWTNKIVLVKLYLYMNGDSKSLKEKLAYADTAYELAKKYELPEQQQSALTYKGFLYASADSTEAAQKYLKMGLSLAKREKAYTNLPTLYNNLAGLYSDPEMVILYLDSALHYAQKNRNVEEEQIFTQNKALFYTMIEDYESAYDHLWEAMQLKDTLLNAEKYKAVTEIEQKYETEKKEQQIVLLAEQNKTQSAQRNFLIAGSIVLLLGLFILGYYYWQKRRIAAKNEEIAQQKIEGLLNEQEIKSYNALIKGQEEERQRIAIDLHDRLGSMLSTVKLLFSALQAKFDKTDKDGLGQYEKASDLLDESCQEVRRVSHNLSTGLVSSLGLKNALEELCSGVNQSGLIKCKLLIYGLDESLESQTEIGIYRIIQETLNNTLKHSKASKVTVQVNRLDESLSVTIEDNGVGFNPERVKAKGGMGLRNLEMRAQKLFGQYHIDSRPGRGSIAMIEIPLNHQQA